MPYMVRCPECTDYAISQGHALVGACASVGIEHGLTTQEMLTKYLAAYHERGHSGDAGSGT